MTKLPERKRLDPAKTREKILAAALDVFAEKGFDGASIADIAAVARTPKSLLQYHFGNKEELWKACLEQTSLPLLQPLDRFLQDGGPARMAELVTARFRVLEANPQVSRMLAWASMGPAPVPDFLADRREQRLRIGGLDPTTSELPRVLLALTAMDGWFLYRNLYRRVLGEMVFEEALGVQFLELLTGAILAQAPVPDVPLQQNAPPRV
jgi:AcrR family transcriptional regulator